MKFITLAALLLITETVQPVNVESVPVKASPVENGLLQTRTQVEAQDFDENVPNLYDNSLVKELDPDTVEDMVAQPQK